MKKSLFLLCCILLPAVFMLAGCSSKTRTEAKSLAAYAARTVQANGLIWKIPDLLHHSFNSVRWYDPATGNTGSLHADPLCMHGMEDQKSCPLANKQIMSVAAVGSTVWFYDWGTMFEEPCGWYRYDFTAQTMDRVADFPETSYEPSKWCIADGYLWYSYIEDPSFGDGKAHICRTPADGSGLDKEAEEMIPGGVAVDEYFDFRVDGGELYLRGRDGSLRRVSDGRKWEHVSDISGGFVYFVRDSRPMENPADLPESVWSTTLRVYDLWRAPVDGGEDEAVLLAGGICSSPLFFGNLIVVTPADPQFLYSFLPTERSEEEDRIFGVDVSGGRYLLFDAATGEETGEVAVEGLYIYGIVGAGEDWIVAHGLVCRDFEPTGDLKTLEGVTQDDMAAHEAYFRVDRKTGEITRVDPAFWQ